MRAKHQALVEFMMEIAAWRTDVMARAEMFAIARQHDAFHHIIIGRALECVVERIGHLAILGVVETGAVHRDPRDAVHHFI